MNRARGGIFLTFLILFFLAILAGILYLARHPLLRAAGRIWIVDESPTKADAIIVLSDDNYLGERASRAAELFRAGWAPRVVASGRMLRPSAGIAELIQRDLIERGVPAAAVVRFPHRAENTRDEAEALRGLVVKERWHRVLLVTSNFHTRRARYLCARIFPAGTELRVVSARDSDYDPDHWWETRLGVKTFFREALGMLVALWEVRHEQRATSENWLLGRFHIGTASQWQTLAL
jgi:uncharacterized SAM-binding protein YcdF (DUF218 family)